MNTPDARRHVMMLGTFGFRPKATMSVRALGIALALRARGYSATIATVPWDNPSDAGRAWDDGGVRVVNTRFTSQLAAPLAVAELRALIGRQRPDLIHLFKPKGFGDLAARIKIGAPVVVDMDDWEGDRGWNDDLPYGRLQRRLFDWQERTWPARAAAVTAASRTLVQRAIELGARPERVFYVPNGLSDRRLAEIGAEPATLPDAVRRLDSIDGPKALVYTRFVEFGAGPLVDMLARLAPSHPDLHLVIAGESADGSAERRLNSDARRAGVAGRVIRLGWIDPAWLGAIARRCDLALFPFEDTLINRAKCSVKVLEALASGVPVVATSVGENRGYIRHGETGLLVRPGAPAALADGVRTILEHPERAGDLAANALRRVEADFAWETLVKRSVASAYRIALDYDRRGNAT